MIIKGSCSFPFKYWDEYLKHTSNAGSVPAYIKTKGPYINLGPEGMVSQFIFYEFEETKYAEAHKWISRHFDELRHIPDFSCSLAITEESPGE
jgi:hypothetical protein